MTAKLEAICGPLGRPVAIYCHIHRTFARRVTSKLFLANAGSVGLPYDGDSRAAYLLLDSGAEPLIRRVPYDLDKEIRLVMASGMPHAD